MIITTLMVNLSPSSNHFTFVLFERVVGRAGRWHCVTFSAGASLGRSGGAKVLGELPVPGLLTSLENSRVRAYCACNRCGSKLFEHFSLLCQWGWSGGAKVLGKLSVPGRPTSLDYSRARAYCACNRCGWGFVWTFFLSSTFSLFFLPLFGRRPDID